ncbi:aldo/keto reductase [Actinospica sp. MGRD01-02]|uniref:Aldo/keto reductase n=1 Tax=Actinospica acidithermotolerans TaxID=2828514 RepID=A0A941EFR7_9ACTN|nr:aldo/keto reductase [Actinospica acidithermotolerans]MBR7829687.1 aldo/keto reductase [Actinospica acidithermotolerans]
MTALTAAFAGRTVFRVGYGALQLERLQQRPGEAVALLRRAIELGVEHVDTAEFYGFGFANHVIRQTLRPEDGVLIVTKVGADPNPGGRLPLRLAQRAGQLRASVEDNLRSLGVERLEVVNLRRLDSGPGLRPEGDQVVDLDDQLAELAALRDEGKIGAIGLSCVTIDGLRRALPVGIVCVQNAYSLVSRDDEDMLALCAAEGIAWVPFFPLGGALPGLPKVTDEPAVHAAAASSGATPAQVGLAWLLHHAPHLLLIPGTADPAHLQANMAAAATSLDAAALASLDAVESRSNAVALG